MILWTCVFVTQWHTCVFIYFNKNCNRCVDQSLFWIRVYVCVCVREGLSAVLFFIIFIVRLIFWFCFQHNYIQLCIIPYCNKLYVSEYIVCAYVCVWVSVWLLGSIMSFFAALLACVWNICGTHILCMPVGSAFFIV